ncbi:MAG: CpsB/CapC family capsule biosynthesis tyrosine phosphatase [Candidatus Angelobacter sp.]
MVDIHCHVLPGIDDGARSWEIAESMCQLAAADGVAHIVATPHANSKYGYDREKFSALLATLQERIGGTLQFSLGCDFHLSYENIDELFKEPKKFLIGDTKYFLIELSDFGLPPNYQQLLFRFRSELGLIPILTHPERHPILQQQPQSIMRWIEAGALIQVTANSLTGHWGRRAKSTALWLLKNQAIHIVATDAHDTKHRPPILSDALAVTTKEIGAEKARRLVVDNPRSVVENREITL